MKSRIASTALLLALALLSGCNSKETIEPVSSVPPLTTPVTVVATPAAGTDTTGRKLIVQGTFVSNVHTTSGTVAVYEKAGGRTLVFTNFKTDGGPDLRIYVAENTNLRNFVELTKLSNSGNFSMDLPASIDPKKQRYVLIWCKAFSVLFGNAELK